MLIRKCDMCGRIDEEFDTDKTCCDQCEHLADKLKRHTTLIEGPPDPNPLMEMRIVVLKD